MLIVQSDDLDRDRGRLAEVGARTIWKLDLPEIRGTHLHPKDTGGTLLSVDQPKAAAEWHWAGPKWREHVRRDVVAGIRNVELQSDAPRALAVRWAEVLGKPVRGDGPDRFAIALD